MTLSRADHAKAGRQRARAAAAPGYWAGRTIRSEQATQGRRRERETEPTAHHASSPNRDAINYLFSGHTDQYNGMRDSIRAVGNCLNSPQRKEQRRLISNSSAECRIRAPQRTLRPLAVRFVADSCKLGLPRKGNPDQRDGQNCMRGVLRQGTSRHLVKPPQPLDDGEHMLGSRSPRNRPQLHAQSKHRRFVVSPAQAPMGWAPSLDATWRACKKGRIPPAR